MLRSYSTHILLFLSNTSTGLALLDYTVIGWDAKKYPSRMEVHPLSGTPAGTPELKIR